MSLGNQPIIVSPYVPEERFSPADDLAGWIISESAPQYRPRHPEQTAVYQLLENHLDSYVQSYEERFESSSGPLRPVVIRSVEEFLACGRLQAGFARIQCPKCHAEHLLAFSCRTRNFCSSCQAKRSVLFAEKLTSEILAPVPHRHWTFSIPRVLRGLFERDPNLLGVLSQTAYAAILKSFQALFDRTDVRPPAASSLCKRSVPMGEIGIPMPTPWFLMACSPPKGSSCRCLRWIPLLSCSSSGASFWSVSTRLNGFRRHSATSSSPGFTQASPSSPERPSKPAKHSRSNPRPDTSPVPPCPWTRSKNNRMGASPCRLPPLLAPAPPPSPSIRWNGFTGSSRIFQIQASIPDARMELTATAPECLPE